jgi:uncharacterized membrane protein
MPYCCKCGRPVQEADIYCAACGASQRPSAGPAPAVQPSGLNSRSASILCYIPFVGWIAAIVVLASEKFRTDRTARFNAFQGLYLFVAWLIVRWVIRPIPFFFLPGGRVPHVSFDLFLQLAIIGVWIFMLVKVSQDQTYSLPILGELAHKSVSES